MKKGDLLICISSSGNSKNIVNAVKYSKSLKIRLYPLQTLMEVI